MYMHVPMLYTMRDALDEQLQEETREDVEAGAATEIFKGLRQEVKKRDAEQKGTGEGQQQLHPLIRKALKP